VVGVAHVRGEDELMLITQQGKILRMLTWSIRAIGRATQGVRLIEMEDGDRVVSIARLAEQVDDDAGDSGEEEG
jgi:DNA gyrase subunit A